MPGTDLTTALGRLLSDSALRRAHARDPAGVALRLGVCVAHLEPFLGLDCDGVEMQAQALIAKRYHEAAIFLPVTISRLGDEARTRFFEYADGAWPTGHRRHLEDAAAFCEHLSLTFAGLCRAEHNWLRFLLARRRWAVHFVPQFPDGIRLRPALQLLYRRHSGAVRQAVFFLPRELRWSTSRHRHNSSGPPEDSTDRARDGRMNTFAANSLRRIQGTRRSALG